MKRSRQPRGSVRRVVHLTSVHRAFDVRIFEKECKALAEAGYEVVLIAPHQRNEISCGIRVIGVPSGRKPLHRWLTTVPLVVVRAFAAGGDVYHFHDPELLPVGALLAVSGRRVIWDCHEDISHVSERPWIPRGTKALVQGMAMLLRGIGARLVDVIVVAEPEVMSRFRSDRAVLVQNYPILSEWDGEVQPLSARERAGCYVGDITTLRGAWDMVVAMETAGPKGVRLLLAGTFHPPRLREELACSPGWEYVDCLGFLDRAGVVRLMAERARAGLILLHPVAHYQASQPVKLFEYMAAGIPVVAYDLPKIREIVSDVGCGVLVRPGDPVEAGEALSAIIESEDEAAVMGARGRRAVFERFSWSGEVRRLLEVYRAL